MPTVVNNDNFMTLVQGGKIEPFVPPTAANAEKSADTAPAEGKALDSASSQSSTTVGDAGKKRNPDGTFAKAGETPAAVDEDDETENLTESVRKKIGKQVRRRKEAEEFARSRDADAERERTRAARLEAELAEIRGKKSGNGPAPASDDGDDPKPQQKDFTTVGDWAEAIADWKVKLEAKKAREAAATSRQQNDQQTRVQAFVTAQDAFKAQHPDYEEVLETVEDDQMPPVAMNYIVENPDVGPALAYHLAKNPSEISRLRKLSPTRVIAELGKLEDKLSKSAEPAAKPANGQASTTRTTSQAPAPTEPIDARSAPAVPKDPAKMTLQELRAFREAERKAARR